jgi:hypothetical protein
MIRRLEQAVGADSWAPSCDPFGFCPGSLDQMEIMAVAIVRF